jgi:hypothetical protein
MNGLKVINIKNLIIGIFIITSCINQEDPCSDIRNYEKEKWNDVVKKLGKIPGYCCSYKIRTNKRVIIQSPMGLLYGDLKVDDSLVKPANSFRVTVYRNGGQFASYDFADGNCDEYDKKPYRDPLSTVKYYKDSIDSKLNEFGKTYRENR